MPQEPDRARAQTRISPPVLPHFGRNHLSFHQACRLIPAHDRQTRRFFATFAVYNEIVISAALIKSSVSKAELNTCEHIEKPGAAFMRIAQISPLFEAVPPKLYGGTERVVYSLTEELVAMGHDVTLFASGDPITSAKLAPMRDQALRLDPTVIDWIAIYMRMMELIYRRADEFDVLHFHTDYFPLSLFSRQRTPFLTTLHGRLDIPEFKDVYELFDAPFVSISDSQRRPIPRLNWIRTVHHGMPADLLTPQPVKQRVPGVPRTHLAGKGRRQGDPHCRRGRHAVDDRRQGRQGRREYFESEIEPLIAASPHGSSSSARSTTARNRRSSPGHTRCCSRSTGPSRSAW